MMSCLNPFEVREASQTANAYSDAIKSRLNPFEIREASQTRSPRNRRKRPVSIPSKSGKPVRQTFGLYLDRADGLNPFEIREASQTAGTQAGTQGARVSIPSK